METQLGLMTQANPESAGEIARQGQERHTNAHLKPPIGSNICKCYGCGEVFNSLFAFDAHQRLENGRPICTHPLDITDRHGNPKPMAINRYGYWVTELRERTEPDSDREAELAAWRKDVDRRSRE